MPRFIGDVQPDNSIIWSFEPDVVAEPIPEPIPEPTPDPVPTGECDVALIEGKDISAIPVMTKPDKGIKYNDLVYGTCITRLSDHVADGKTYIRNDYARRDSFNADSSKFLTYTGGGDWAVYDRGTLAEWGALPLAGDAEPQWHPTNPYLLYYLPNNGGLVINQIELATGSISVAVDFAQLAGGTSILDTFPTAGRVWTRSEGSSSADGRYWAFQVETSGFDPLGLITYDIQTNTIVGVYNFADHGNVSRPNNISMSPSGQYAVCGWGSSSGCTSPNAGTYDSPCGVMVFDQTLSAGYSISQRAEHMDIGLDAAGDDVLVISNYASGWLESINLTTKVITQLFSLYEQGGKTSMHISCKNYDRQGWALISTYASTVTDGWFNDKIMLVELTDNPRILNLAHTQNITTTYFNEVHGAINRAGDKAVFNSNWQSSDIDVDVYEIIIPKVL